MFNNYEIVEYTHSLSLQIRNFTGRTIQDDRGDIKDVLEHWHLITYLWERRKMSCSERRIQNIVTSLPSVKNTVQ